jgi:hypothetical protein
MSVEVVMRLVSSSEKLVCFPMAPNQVNAMKDIPQLCVENSQMCRLYVHRLLYDANAGLDQSGCYARANRAADDLRWV